MRSERFVCPSSGIGLGALMRRSRRSILVALTLAATGHLALASLRGVQAEVRAAKPLTTQFVKRAPRLTKPLELKKRPQPKRRAVQREMVAVKARTARDQAVRGLQPAEALRGLARPRVEMARGLGAVQTAVEPRAVAQAFEGAMQSEDVVDMSLEMVDIEALDTGQYHAMVIQDPGDKRNVRGFFHLLLARPHALSVIGGRGNGESIWDNFKKAIGRIANGMNEYTQVRTDVIGQITFDDADLFKVPWVLTPIPDPHVRLSPSEALNMGRYLEAGGFEFLENGWGLPAPGDGGGYEVATREVCRETMESIGLILGKQWEYERLPEDHPIYHCYFDFSMPPPGKDMNMMQYSGYGRVVHNYLEGVTLEGRLWILFSQKGLALGIFDHWPGSYYPYKGGDPMRMVQFCINTIIFALTQEGSITNRVMDVVR
jgi:hypothetical protein